MYQYYCKVYFPVNTEWVDPDSNRKYSGKIISLTVPFSAHAPYYYRVG